ncbi:hypothetical protein [Paenibacillus cremeus]|uniref:Uncharacterized protein n=1 Tax=Paenibacillus cremeus TaxID=2163881 RepID=A0A559K0L1_9BACL|nr:hypothetical protein [Paenibacillus cremeus]TVY05689.1 hypothetical protein FPZ49_28875 [Paenibacillus cremeus]
MMSIQELENRVIRLYDVKSQLKAFIYQLSEEAFEKGDRARDQIKTIEQLEDRNAWMRQKFIESMGGLPSNDSPLRPQIVGTIQCDGYRIEKIIFESRSNVFVTSNLYVPDGITSPRGAVLFLCGHLEQAKCADEYQIVCQYLTRAGH